MAEAFDNGSASSMERSIECPASLVLPRTRRSSPHAERGNTIHAHVRHVLGGMSHEHALRLIDDAATKETCRRLDFSKLGGMLTDVRCEVAYALDPIGRRARELGVNVGRDYGRFDLTAHDIPGTNDIEGVALDGVPEGIDLKTGWDRVTPCAENAQMLFYAACRMFVTGADVVRWRIAYVRKDGRVEADDAVFTRLDLESFVDAAELALLRARAARKAFASTGSVDVAEGPWCKYCPAHAYCPSKVRLARAMLPELEEVGPQIAALTREQAGAAWLKAKQIEGLLEAVLDALKERAGQEPLPTRPGKVVRPIEHERDDFRASTAIALLREKGATDDEIRGCYRSARVVTVRETNDGSTGKRRARGKAA